MLKLKVIELETCCYLEVPYSHNYPVDKLLVNGEPLIPMEKKYWYKAPRHITKIEMQGSSTHKNIRFELKEGFPETDLTPKVLNMSSLYDTEYDAVSGLYEKKFDVVPGGYEEVPFELTVLDVKRDDFKFKEQPSYVVSYLLLDEIETHPDLLFEKPCSIGGEPLYNIVRTYLKDKIDPRYAQFDTGYSWKTVVSKKIGLANPTQKRYDSNSGTRRKPKWITESITTKSVPIIYFENSSSSKIFPPTIHGENLEDLDRKLHEYLDSLVALANEPLKECPHCAGLGVLKQDDSIVKY